ncbi:MAG TPA: amidase [Vicinamibacterales bacterium]|jgi:aspartyl-tRNA(Asn)/glutamyl-tRNA(Gln) amidotransferase subunit A
MSRPLELLPLTDLASALRVRRITSEALTQACLARIDADSTRLNTFILVLRDEALETARQADRDLAAGRDRGALHGIPISLKDLLDLRGTPTTAASRVREGHVAQTDAPVVVRLREAGAVFVGKTNLHEFAFGTTSEDSAFGPVRNPLAPDRSAGGSSGGSAAGIAAGMAVASIGTDTGGSIRIPAAVCGTVGLKPAFDDLPIDGIVPLNRSCDHVGPLARTVEDAWLVYRAMRGDVVAAGERLVPIPPIRGLRVGVLRPYFTDLLDDEVRARFDEGLAALGAAGAVVRDRAIPHAADIAPIYLHTGLPEAAAYHGDTLDRMPERYSPNVRIRLELGRYMLAEDYVRAQDGRRVLRQEVDAALAECEVLALPTVAIPAPLIGASAVRVGSRQESIRNIMLRLTQLFNLTGHPAISLPCGATRAGLPCGLQLVSAARDTERLLRVAAAVERVLR